MSDGRDNAFARIESRILALELEVAALKRREHERAELIAERPVIADRDTLHLPQKGRH